MKNFLKWFTAAQGNTLIDGRYCLGMKSSVGAPHLQNEDCAHVAAVDTPLGCVILGAVSDGMGGSFGAAAAQAAVNALFSAVAASSRTNPVDLLEDAMQAANAAVYKMNLVERVPSFCTLAAALIVKDRLYVANVGNSRVYWMQSNGRLLQLTQDHTYANLMGNQAPLGEADKLAHVIGRKARVGVDLGFYLEGVGGDPRRAFQLGEAGLPLQDGEAVLLCTDGLIGRGADGRHYVDDAELVDAMQTEYAPGAAVKMIGFAEGRKVQDNLSAVVIQRLTDARIAQMNHNVMAARRKARLMRIGAVTALALLALGVIISIGILVRSNAELSAARQATRVVYQITSTPQPSPTATAALEPGKMRVENVWGEERASYQDSAGNGGVLLPGMYIEEGTVLRSADGNLKLVASSAQNAVSEVYVMPTSDVRVSIQNELRVELLRGGALIRPAVGMGYVHLPAFGGAVARVMGSRMLVQVVRETEVVVMCFEGECGFQAPAQPDIWQGVPAGEKRIYDLLTGVLQPSQIMTFEEQYQVNLACSECVADLLPTLTPTSMMGFNIMPTGTSEPREDSSQPVIIIKTTEPASVVDPTPIPCRNKKCKP